ncbi:MAG: PD40 domain-containing protein [Planctomycetes bacterium]|nr:PD40 domain-containing protein [Planctomycetota bacterium]
MRWGWTTFAFAALLAACASEPTTVSRPEIWEPPELTPGTAYFSFDVSSVSQHTSASKTAYAHPALSPDGKSLAYSATVNGEHADIFIQDIAGRAAREVARHPLDDITPAFRADGTQLAFASNRDGRWNIYVADLKVNSPLLQVTDDGWENFAPCFSPDGKWIAYSTRRNAGEPWLVALADLDSGTRTLLCEGSNPSFSPVDPLIVFSRNSRRAPGWPSLWTIRTDGTEQTEIYRSDDHGAVLPTFAGPNWILFSTVGKLDGNARDGFVRADDIWMITLRGARAGRVTWHGMQDWDAVYDALGERCFYVSNRDGGQNIFSAALYLPKLESGLGGGR